MHHLIVSLATLALVASACGQKYELTVLGTYGRENSGCSFISESGDVLGATWDDGQGLPPHYFGFRYRAGVMSPLQALPGYLTSSAGSQNRHGVAVGACTQGYEGPPHAAMWDAKGNVTPVVDFIKGYGDVSSARQINDAGQIVLNVGGKGYPYGAFLWEQGRLTEILPGYGYSGPYVSGINENGQVSGLLGPYPSAWRAFRWDRG